MKIRYLTTALCGFWLAAVAPAQASALFWTISGDPNNSFVPDQLSSIDLIVQTVTNIATLGDGSLGFNGGLTFGPGTELYAIANDFTEASSLYSIQADGTASLVGAAGGLGYGFLGGLTWDPDDSTFYAAALDPEGDTSLYAITPGGAATELTQDLPAGFSGLAYDTANSTFYGIGNDFTGLSTLYDFSLGGPASSLGALGYGFGALTYDAVAETLWAIDPVNNYSSQLIQISTGGVESAPAMTLGDGFDELAVAPAPEPATSMEIAIGLIGLSALLKTRRRRRAGSARGSVTPIGSGIPA